jgi:hypothetical protein
MSTSQGIERILGIHQKLGVRYRTNSPSDPLERTNSIDTFSFSSLAPELWGNKFLWF